MGETIGHGLCPMAILDILLLMVLDTFKMENQIGIVTGVGQGLGRIFCHAFAEASAAVVVAEINAQSGPEAVKEVKDRRRRSLFAQTDVRHKPSVDQMVDRTLG